MIKMDIVSGFLGAGKTTLIKKYLQALRAKGENVVLVENDFGSIGIDKKLLQVGSLEIYEINQGCLCCSLRGNFVMTLQEIAQKIKPDRVIIEPSGIFILSEIFDFFTYSSVEENYVLNSIVTVVDALNYEDEKEKFGQFFVNQIESAQALVLSKTTFVSEADLLAIVEELADQYHGREIIACDWDALDDDDVYQIFHAERSLQATAARLKRTKRNFREHKRERGLHGFTSCSFHPKGIYTADDVAQKLEDLRDMGEVLRGKGFLAGTDGQWEFQYVNGQYQIKPQSKDFSEPAVCFIGKNLGKEAILAAFA